MNSLSTDIMLNPIPVVTAYDTIFKKPSVSPNTAEFPMFSHLLPSILCPYCGFACKGLAEARDMWHTVVRPHRIQTLFPSSIPSGQLTKPLIWSHCMAQHLLFGSHETVCRTHGRCSLSTSFYLISPHIVLVIVFVFWWKYIFYKTFIFIYFLNLVIRHIS